MAKFIDSERIRQAQFKQESLHFSHAAKADGMYKGALRDFCLPMERADENLFVGIRQAALDYLMENGIPPNSPNHLCSSQTMCLNVLFPFRDQPAALAALLKPVFPTLDHMLPLVDDGYVEFEWIGERNYLGEKRWGTRGANATSADAMVYLQHIDGTRQIVLIEWKYTESYAVADKRVSDGGTDRSVTYRPFYERDDCPLDKAVLPDFDPLFYEPFYQFMRQQFLAHEMEKAHEFDADRVSLLHIAPAHNPDFQRVTAPALRPLGDTVIDVWKRLVRDESRFDNVAVESLFTAFTVDEFQQLADWYIYIEQRYDWITEV